MEKHQKKLVFGVYPIILLLSLPLLYVAIDFLWGSRDSLDPSWLQYFSNTETRKRTLEEESRFFTLHLQRLVRGEDRRKLDETGFACHKAEYSVHCVSTRPVRLDTRNMTVYVPSGPALDTSVRPYVQKDNDMPQITPVRIVQYDNATSPPPCGRNHGAPAVVFSSGSMGNVFHEMNEIIIPLYITTKHFGSRVVFVLEDYNPSFVAKYGNILSHLSRHGLVNPATDPTMVHCFPGSVVGLKYHDNLALNASDIPGGYGMREFRAFLRETFALKFLHVSQIPRPRLLLLSRTGTRRFLNEDEIILLMRDVGFEVIVARGSKVASNLNKFSHLINSCSVLLGAHGAGLTNEIFLPTGGVMIQLELLGVGWASDTYYGDTARAMGVHYLKYKIEIEESSLVKLYGRNSSVVTDPGSVYRDGGLGAMRTVFLDQQNVMVNITRFRMTLVQALSIVTDWPATR